MMPAGTELQVLVATQVGGFSKTGRHTRCAGARGACRRPLLGRGLRVPRQADRSRGSRWDGTGVCL